MDETITAQETVEHSEPEAALDQVILYTSDVNGGQPTKRSHRLYILTLIIGIAALVIAVALLAQLPFSHSQGFDGIIAVIFTGMGVMNVYNATFAKKTLVRLVSESRIDLYDTRVRGVGFINEKKNKLRRVEFDYEYSDLVGVNSANDILTIYPFARSAIMCYAVNAEDLKDKIHDMSWEQR